MTQLQLDLRCLASCDLFLARDYGQRYLWVEMQVIDASISESVFNMLEGCISEYAMLGHDRQPSGSTISGVFLIG